MKSLTRKWLVSWLAAAAMMTLVAMPVAANKPGYTLTLSGPSTVAVGKPFTMTASGTDVWDTNLPIPMFDAHYLDVDAIPTGTTTTCPSSYETAIQLADSTGGAVIAAALNENPDSQGHFSVTVGYTPRAPAQMLICAYTEDALTSTYAVASLTMTFASGGGGTTSSPGARPANRGKPWITRSGNTLTCNRGSWTHQPRWFRYGWLVNGRVKQGARGPHLSVTPQLNGHTVQCRVTAHNAAGTGTATSPAFFVR